jgi:hypothetical protein
MIARWAVLGCVAVLLGSGAAIAQAPAPAADDAAPTYKPPSRGTPGGRVGGASRGVEAAAAFPTIEPLAPDRIAGQTANASPTLYYFISRPASQQLMLTISAPSVAKPLVEAAIPAPKAAGIQALRLADRAVQLQPGIVYTWSISLVLDPQARSKDIVASASIVRAALDPAVDSAARAAAPLRRAAMLAQAGFWYDAINAAVEGEAGDRHAALDALLDQVGLTEPARVDRQSAGAGR